MRRAQLLALLASLALACFAPAPASAAAHQTLSLQVKPAVLGETVIVGFSGTVDNSFKGGIVQLTLKPAGAGAGCASTFASDSGTHIEDLEMGDVEPGPVSYSGFGEFPAPAPGSYLICAWLEESEGALVAAASASQQIEALSAKLALQVRGVGASCIAACSGPLGRGRTQLVVSFAVNGPALLVVDLRPVSGPGCAPEPGGEPQAVYYTETTVSSSYAEEKEPYDEISEPEVGENASENPLTSEQRSPLSLVWGPESEAGTFEDPYPLRAGRYRVCAWITRHPAATSTATFGPVAAGPDEVIFAYPTKGIHGTTFSLERSHHSQAKKKSHKGKRCSRKGKRRSRKGKRRSRKGKHRSRKGKRRYQPADGSARSPARANRAAYAAESLYPIGYNQVQWMSVPSSGGPVSRQGSLNRTWRAAPTRRSPR